MNKPIAYTPLESLFLFQSLLTHGVDPSAFVRISEVLKDNALIKADSTYDAARFTPEALQQLFLLVLGEEIRSETDRPEPIEAPVQKKRKVGTPPLPTLKDAIQHVDKVPILVQRLYARYRDHVVKQIREDERKFETVQKEIQLLERSEKERLARSASQSGTPVLAPRDPRPMGSNSPSPSPGPTSGVLAGIKRPPPLAAATKLPPSGIASPGATTPTHFQPGTTPIRAAPSPNPLNGSLSTVSQPSTGAPAAAPLHPKPIAQTGRSVASPRSDTSGDVPGSLKWEKPYTPPPSVQTPTGLPPNQPLQPLQATNNSSTTSQHHNQHHHQQQQRPLPQLQQQQQQFPPQSLAQSQVPLANPQVLQPRPVPGKTHTPTAHAGQAPIPLGPQQNPDQFAQQSRPSTGPPPAGAQNHTLQPASLPEAVRAALSAAQHRPLSPLGQTPMGRKPPPVGSTRPNLAAAVPPGGDDKVPQSPYGANLPRPAIPEHMIRQVVGTPNQGKRAPSIASVPQTPVPTSPMTLTRGFGTKWASHSTPSTPGPIMEEPESPAFEPVSPPQRSGPFIRASSKSVSVKDSPILRAQASKSARALHSHSNQRGRAVSTTPSLAGTRRSMSAMSQPDELSIDQNVVGPRKIKKEMQTPRPHDETGDTTADESIHGRTRRETPGTVTRKYKRKRIASPVVTAAAPVSQQVLWTRGFTKVSSSALDQISSHRDANMFATALREKDAPNYRQVVLQPQDITSIRAAIKHGNKTASQAAANLSGGDPGTASVWLPRSGDLTPPRAIINSAQLDRELVHMFCNAIMYNPDPDRGFGPSFIKGFQDEEEEALGYELDENGVVRNTQGMFLEVEKLLGDLRNAERDRAPPPPTSTNTRQPSVAAYGDETAEEEDELAGDGDTTTQVAKRRRVSSRI